MSQKNFYSKPRQADVVAGSANFASILATDFAALGVSSAQQTAYAAVNTALQAAWLAGTTPETRTTVTVEAKNDAIKAMRVKAVALAEQIIRNPAVSDSTLISLGLLPRTSPQPRPAVQTAPELRVIKVVNRLVTIGIKQANLESDARPIGCVGAYIFSYVGNSAPTDPNAYHFEGLATKKIVEVSFPNEVASGATVFISAAWVSQRNGARGFACTPVSATLQGGPVLAGESA